MYKVIYGEKTLVTDTLAYRDDESLRALTTLPNTLSSPLKFTIPSKLIFMCTKLFTGKKL